MDSRLIYSINLQRRVRTIPRPHSGTRLCRFLYALFPESPLSRIVLGQALVLLTPRKAAAYSPATARPPFAVDIVCSMTRPFTTSISTWPHQRQRFFCKPSRRLAQSCQPHSSDCLLYPL